LQVEKIELKIKHVILLLFAIIGEVVSAQNDEHDGHDHESEHEHHKNEIGIANSPVYFVKEKEFSYGLHLHYVHAISNSKFGIGLGYERIFDEHQHNTIGLVLGYRPVDRLNVNLSPGVTFEANGQEVKFALHAETAYEFELGNFHIGPAFEIAYDPEDYGSV
jgi:hypothetical protein